MKEQKNESNPSAQKVEKNKQEPKEAKRVVENMQGKGFFSVV